MTVNVHWQADLLIPGHYWTTLRSKSSANIMQEFRLSSEVAGDGLTSVAIVADRSFAVQQVRRDQSHRNDDGPVWNEAKPVSFLLKQYVSEVESRHVPLPDCIGSVLTEGTFPLGVVIRPELNDLHAFVMGIQNKMEFAPTLRNGVLPREGVDAKRIITDQTPHPPRHEHALHFQRCNAELSSTFVKDVADNPISLVIDARTLVGILINCLMARPQIGAESTVSSTFLDVFADR